MNGCEMCEAHREEIRDRSRDLLHVLGAAREMITVLEGTGHDGLMGKGVLAALNQIDDMAKELRTRLTELS